MFSKTSVLYFWQGDHCHFFFDYTIIFINYLHEGWCFMYNNFDDPDFDDAVSVNTSENLNQYPENLRESKNILWLGTV